MTSIGSTNSGSTALLLLRQTRASMVSGNADGNATGTRLDTTSGDKDAVMATIKRLATAWQARRSAQANTAPSQAAAAGTVSVAASSAWLSGMASATAAAMGASRNAVEIGTGGTSIAQTVDTAEADERMASATTAFTPLTSSLNNAVAVTGGLVRQIIRYNAQFHLMEVPTREEWTASVKEGETYCLSRGQDPDQAKARTEFALSDQGYQNRVLATEETNQAMLSNAKDAPEAIDNAKGHLNSVFCVKVRIDFDNNGEMKLGGFNIRYTNGQKMLSYGEDGSMTIYDQEGNVTETLRHRQVATLGYF